MTNKEAYIIDLDDILKDAENLLRIVPVGKTKDSKRIREEAEQAYSRIKVTIGCMKNDYIILE